MFGGGGGGLNPRKMRQMMKQMGIDVDELDVEEAIIRTSDGEELVFDSPDVTRMDARGQQTYQVVGDPEIREMGADEGGEGGDEGDEADTTGDGSSVGGTAIPDADVEIVAERTGASEYEAREALEAEDGDLAAAVSRLE
jgi:nascent polypeptide-associated complex subunit alpha